MPSLLVLHLVVLAWAFTAILGKLIAMPALDLVVWRAFLATAGFLVLALALRAPIRLKGRDAATMLVLGALLGFHWFLFFLSARFATASVSLAALPTMMLWCSLLEPLVNRSRRWSRVELIVGLVVVGAVWSIYASELRHWLGFTTGIFAALVAAVYAVWNKQIVARFHWATLCAWQFAGAGLATWALLPAVGGTLVPALPGPADFGWLLVLAFGCTLLPYAGFVHVMRRLPIFTLNVVYNLEPFYGIVLAALVFGEAERMTPGFYLGAALIVLSVMAVPWLQKLADRPTPV